MGSVSQYAHLPALPDFDHRRAAYFRQMRFGLFVRMALLTMVMSSDDGRA